MNLTITGTARPRSASIETDALVLRRTVPVLTEAEAPVAVSVTLLTGRVLDRRWSNGKFFRLYYSRERIESMEPGQLEAGLETQHWYDSSEDAAEQLQAKLEQFIVIDGEVWVAVPEPALMIDARWNIIDLRDPYGIAPWRVYSPLESDTVAEGRRRAETDGRWGASPSRLHTTVDVLMPEVFTAPLHEERMEEVRAQAAAAAAKVIARLDDLTPESYAQAARDLAVAADQFNQATSGYHWTPAQS